MSLSLIFLLLGASMVAGAALAITEARPLAARVVAASALTCGGLMFVIGLVNALSGTM
jgi:multisubunit Na+/H+ antiporter MnhG subunit